MGNTKAGGFLGFYFHSLHQGILFQDNSKKINGGNSFKTSKGAPQVLLKLVEGAGGCDAAMKKTIEKDVTEPWVALLQSV